MGSVIFIKPPKKFGRKKIKIAGDVLPTVGIPARMYVKLQNNPPGGPVEMSPRGLNNFGQILGCKVGGNICAWNGPGDLTVVC